MSFSASNPLQITRRAMGAGLMTLAAPAIVRAGTLPAATFGTSFNNPANFAATVSGFTATGQPCWRSVNGSVNPIYQACDHLNAESERYTASTDLASPFTVASGALHMTAPAGPGPTWPSGSINSVTMPGGIVHSGRLEVQALLPLGQGLWPAIWMLTQDASWPGEIDVMEQIGQPCTDWYATTGLTEQNKLPKRSVIYQSEHSGPNGNDSPSFTQPVFIRGDTSAAYHSYGIDFGPSEMIYYIDGVETWRCTTPPRLVTNLATGMYLLVNLALGGPGSWAGIIDPKVLPATMSVRSIKVYPQGTQIPVMASADTQPMLYNTTYNNPRAYVPPGFKAGPATIWAGD